jgi:hypothetical protein
LVSPEDLLVVKSLDVEKNMTCRVSKQSGLAKLIIWDELKHQWQKTKQIETIEALDKMLQARCE